MACVQGIYADPEILACSTVRIAGMLGMPFQFIKSWDVGKNEGKRNMELCQRYALLLCYVSEGET